MSTNFTSTFLEDNFLSDDDWGVNHGKEFADLEFDGNKVQDKQHFSNNLDELVEIGLQRHDSCLAKSNGSLSLSFNSSVESSPLTPPDDMLSSDSHSSHFETVDELLADLIVDESQVQQFQTPFSQNENANQLEQASETNSSSRGRSASSGSSSSTSAYSSQSSTPPPVSKPVSDFFDPAFCEVGSFGVVQQANGCMYSSHDEGFHEAVSQNGNANFQLKTQEIVHRLKATNPEKFAQPVKTDVEDFDRKVQEALRETNRLLKMHNQPTKPNLPRKVDVHTQNGTTSQHAQPINLKKVCDSVILKNKAPLPLSTSLARTTSEKSRRTKLDRVVQDLTLKRKAMENALPRHQAKKILVSSSPQSVTSSQEQAISIPEVTAAQNIVIPSTPVTCNNAPVSTLQIPLQSIDSVSPMKIIVKREPTNSNIFVNTTQPMSVNLTTSQNVITVPMSQNQLASIPTQNFSPMKSFVVKDETNKQISVSPLNQPTQVPLTSVTASQPVLTLVSGSTDYQVKSQPKLLPCVVKQETVQSPSDARCGNGKRLMCSAAVSKKTIVPAVNGVQISPIASASFVADQAVYQKQRLETPCGNNAPVLDGNLISKRQQRMIKNRESACQSRQRRKEYVQSLEQQMQEYAEENQQLKTLNQQLKKRVSDLEEENATFRKLAFSSMTGQRKAACLLMLVLFIGFNVHPYSFLTNSALSGAPGGAVKLAVNTSDESGLPTVQLEAGYHGRQLLSHDENSTLDSSPKVAGTPKALTSAVALPDLNQKRAFWVDDLVKDCKKKHFRRIQEVLQDTSSLSLQRLLRRKLKEELGIRIPLTMPRIRRIAYNAQGTPSYERSPSPIPIENIMELNTNTPEHKMPPSPPTIKKASAEPVIVAPSCDHVSKVVDHQPNETDSARISDDLARWVQRHKSEEKKPKPNSNHHKHRSVFKNAKGKRPPKKERHSSKTKTSVAVYQGRDQRLKKLLEAIDRRNDTVYVISFSKDHVLLPAITRNASRQTRMSLVMPTVSPNESFANDEEYQTMIQINCEVTGTEYFKVTRNAFPKDLPISNYNPKDKRRKLSDGSENPKRNAYHGSAGSEMKRESKLAQSDEDATVTDVLEL